MLQKQNAKLEKKIQSVEETTRIYKAEWAYLTSPAVVEAMVIKLLPAYKPMQPSQLQEIRSILGTTDQFLLSDERGG